MSSYVDCHISSRDRVSWPNGTPYGFNANSLFLSGPGTNYQVVLQQAEIPNQYANIWNGINDRVYFSWAQGPTVDSSVHLIDFILTVNSQNWTGPMFASAIQTALQASATTNGWAGAASIFCAFDTTQGALVFTLPSGYGLNFIRGNTQGDAPNGYPTLYPGERGIQMLGLHRFASGYAGSSPIIGGANAVVGDPIAISGSKFVDIVTNLSTQNFHSNGIFNNRVIGRLPLGPLGTVMQFVRSEGDRASCFANATDLQHLRFDLYDEWGVPFFLASNQNIALSLRLYSAENSED